jgi:hypothetical protein
MEEDSGSAEAEKSEAIKVRIPSWETDDTMGMKTNDDSARGDDNVECVEDQCYC